MHTFIFINRLTAILFFAILTSCSLEGSVEKPDDLIQQPEMVDVLADICKVEARFQRRLTIKNINVSEMVEHNYSLVFEKHNISLVQFKQSYDYYEYDPEIMQQIYDSVIVHLTEEQALLNEVNKEAADSEPEQNTKQ